MPLKIDRDHSRFKQIVRGRIKKDLGKYIITNDEILGKKGEEIIKIPLPRIDIPRFKYDFRQLGGVGQGDGEVGDILGSEGSGTGNKPGLGDDGNMEVEVFVNDIENILI
ncbi:MAG: DUF444 family protein [Nanoarchaeota archaeon]